MLLEQNIYRFCLFILAEYKISVSIVLALACEAINMMILCNFEMGTSIKKTFNASNGLRIFFVLKNSTRKNCRIQQYLSTFEAININKLLADIEK